MELSFLISTEFGAESDIVASDDNEDIDERLARQDAILKLQKEIDKLELMTRREIQPKKKFELYQELQDKKKDLEEHKNGRIS